MAQPTLARNAPEVQEAHDLLIAILAGAAGEGATPDNPAMRVGICYLSVLCWLLGHEHDNSFTSTLATLKQAMRQRGVEIKDLCGLVECVPEETVH